MKGIFALILAAKYAACSGGNSAQQTNQNAGILLVCYNLNCVRGGETEDCKSREGLLLIFSVMSSMARIAAGMGSVHLCGNPEKKGRMYYEQN